MMGHGHGAFGFADPAFGAGRDLGSPWDNSGGGDLARQAGIDDIGRGAGCRWRRQPGLGLFDSGNSDDAPDADRAFDDSSNDFGAAISAAAATSAAATSSAWDAEVASCFRRLPQ